MKKLLLILPFLFLFSQKINGQTEPRLVKKIKQTYSDVINEYFNSGEERYEYDARGNKILYEINTNDIDGNIISWSGVKYDYDDQNRLIKETNRRYNWEVDLWLVLDWVEFTYDNNGCIKERLSQLNLAISEERIEKIISTDAQCREMEFHVYQNVDDSLSLANIVEIEYDDVERSKLESYNDPDNNILNGTIIFYNEQEEVIKDTMWINLNVLPDYISNTSSSEYIYNSQTEKIDYKKSQFFEYLFDISLPGQIFSSTEVESTYQYSCDGLLIQEDENYSYFSPIFLIAIDEVNRYHYIYEGKDECFDASAHLDMLIYPNPTAGNIQVESTFLRSGNTLVYVFDMNGKVLLENRILSRDDNFSLDIGHLPNGVYTLRISNGEYFLNKKIVVVK